ncbi:MAG: hypothetical protein ACYTEL_15755 [Planctomycetota bacterium]
MSRQAVRRFGNWVLSHLNMNYESRNITVFGAILVLVTLSYITFLSKPLASDDYYFFSPRVARDCWTYFVKDMLADDQDVAFLRPLPILLFAAESHFRQAFPFLPNGVNLFFHLANTCLLGLLILFPYRKRIPMQYVFAPAAGMLIFGLHPQAPGAVCWVSSRFDLMCGFFGLIGLYVWLNSISKANVFRRRVVAITCFALSILSKETGIMFPLSVFLWEMSRCVMRRKAIHLKSQVVALAPLMMLVAAYFVYRYSIVRGLGGYSNVGLGSLGPSGLVGYALVMFWPFANMGPVQSKMLSAILIIMATGVILFISKKKENDSDMCVCPWPLFFLLCLCSLVLLSLIPLKIKQVLNHAESRLSYIPLLGFSILMGWSLDRLRSFTFVRTIATVFLLVFLFFSIVAQQGEVARWNKAGNTAQSIVDQIVTLVPTPPEDATLLFDIPQLMAIDRYYYVFGMGLAEALAERYQREDLNILQWPDDHVLENPPENSYIFKFDWKSYRTDRSVKIELINSP